MQSYSSRTFHNSTLCINKNADYSLTYRNLILYIQERLPKLAEREGFEPSIRLFNRITV